jgi:hypothetical protein
MDVVLQMNTIHIKKILGFTDVKRQKLESRYLPKCLHFNRNDLRQGHQYISTCTLSQFTFISLII